MGGLPWALLKAGGVVPRASAAMAWYPPLRASRVTAGCKPVFEAEASPIPIRGPHAMRSPAGAAVLPATVAASCRLLGDGRTCETPRTPREGDPADGACGPSVARRNTAGKRRVPPRIVAAGAHRPHPVKVRRLGRVVACATHNPWGRGLAPGSRPLGRLIPHGAGMTQEANAGGQRRQTRTACWHLRRAPGYTGRIRAGARH